MVALSTVRNLVFNAAFLASVAAAASVSSGGTPFRPPVPPPPAPPPPAPPKVKYTIDYLPAGGIWTSSDQCSAANQVGFARGPNIANYIIARRISDYGLPNLFIDAAITDTANDHVVDMIRDGYVSIITNDSPPLSLTTQLNLHGVGGWTETKTIILVGCFGNNQLVDLWNVLQSDPGFASIVNRPDWNAIGAVCHHPSLVAGSYPNLPSQNYWQIIFVR